MTFSIITCLHGTDKMVYWEMGFGGCRCLGSWCRRGSFQVGRKKDKTPNIFLGQLWPGKLWLFGEVRKCCHLLHTCWLSLVNTLEQKNFALWLPAMESPTPQLMSFGVCVCVCCWEWRDNGNFLTMKDLYSVRSLIRSASHTPMGTVPGEAGHTDLLVEM